MTDFGTLSSITKLPVLALHYGGAKSRVSRIIYRLDSLVCSGKSTNYPSEEASADRQNLWHNFDTFKNESQIEIENIKQQVINETNKIQEKFQQLQRNQTLDLQATKIELIDILEKSQNITITAFRASGVSSIGNPSK